MDDVHLRGPHAGALHDRNRRRMVGSSLAQKGQRGCYMIRASCASMTTNPWVARVILSGAVWGPTQWGKRSEGSAFLFPHRWRERVWRLIAALSVLFIPLALPAQQHFNGGKAYEYARAFAAIGPR